MKVAVLGCGGLGRVHANMYAKMKDVELTGVCDQQLELALELSEETGALAYSSFEKMLEEAEFDVISIALPSFLHKTYTLQAAKAGKHVICEKPIALSLEDADQMIRCCDENNVRLFVGHVVRFFPDYVGMKRSLDSGKLGRACVAHASRIGGHPGKTKAWYNDLEKSGGVIVDLMIHDLDFLRWTLGEVKTVYALNRSDDQLDYALVTLQFKTGAVANVEANWGFPGPFQTKAEIAGSEGIVMANSMKSSSLQIHKVSSASEASAFVTVPESPGFQSPYELELRHFIASIREGTEAIVSARDAYQALELALAARESVKTGKAVHLPLSLS
ncbi:Gfo/Idh/MocA family protein [Paenibacillus sp. N3.4]|uniref:Gfo/Idh/MocA family protein n=1 Tax=Paenibacillus sp. N3.4 TaxID=2603222 RepID=UPI0011CBA824|nr:Gfo/Idh/MocA family oxidoreductase [Paenibacillus sp. N3.4]TXK84607.1 Gfo/Idh/MocA family oxidoreductase [Paenibacillus sp. N3.4]